MNEATLTELVDRIQTTQHEAKTYVQPLIDNGQIKLTVHEAPSSRKQMYYSEQ